MLVGAWTELPELVTANQGEEGILDLCAVLLEHGIGIEAGLLSLADAHAFVASDIASHCVRAMIEPLRADPDEALAEAEAMEEALAAGGVTLEQVHHGDGIASWAVNRRAVARGHGIRTGLEDTGVMPDGRVASGNGELVDAAAATARGVRAELAARNGSIEGVFRPGGRYTGRFPDRIPTTRARGRISRPGHPPSMQVVRPAARGPLAGLTRQRVAGRR